MSLSFGVDWIMVTSFSSSLATWAYASPSGKVLYSHRASSWPRIAATFPARSWDDGPPMIIKKTTLAAYNFHPRPDAGSHHGIHCTHIGSHIHILKKLEDVPSQHHGAYRPRCLVRSDKERISGLH